MDISIVLLKYNRPEWLVGRMLTLSSFFQASRTSYELIVSDNFSAIAVKDILQKEMPQDCPYKIIMPGVHLETVEEHFRFVIGQCQGDYIWVIGDDDPPNLLGLGRLEEKLLEKDFRLLVFDSNRHYLGGKIENGSLIISDPEDLTSIEKFVKVSGCWYTLAGISNLVFKKPTLDALQSLDEIIATSPIYAHVIWFVATYWGQPFSFISVPLVTYSESGRDTSVSDHWEMFSAQRNVYRNYWWTIGFIHLCEYLRAAKGLPYSWFMDITEVNWWGMRRRPLLSHIAMNLWDEINAKRNVARPISSDEVKEAAQFLVRCNPKYEFMYSFFSTFDFSPENIAEHRNQLDVFMNEIIQKPLFDFFVGRYHDYSMFHVHGRFLAVSNHTVQEQSIHCFDGILGDYQSSFSFASIEELKKWVDENPSKYDSQQERLIQKTEDNVFRIEAVNNSIRRLTELYESRGFIKRSKFILRTILPKPLVRYLKKKRQKLG